MSTPDPLHRTNADPSGLLHRRARPMAGSRRRPCQGQRHNAFGLLWAQRRNARGPRLVAPKPRHAFLAEPFLPAPDHRLGLAGGPHDLGSAMIIRRQKHNLRSPDVLLRAVAVGYHRLKLPAVGGIQPNVGSLVHSLESHTRVRERNSLSESECQIWSTS